MGLFDTIRDRQRSRVEAARSEAEASATKAGASAAEIKTAGDKAAHKQHRRNFLRSGAGHG